MMNHSGRHLPLSVEPDGNQQLFIWAKQKPWNGCLSGISEMLRRRSIRIRDYELDWITGLMPLMQPRRSPQ